MENNSIFSPIIAGAMTWGSWGKTLDKQGMASLMEHCYSQGITTFDHADIYGGYTTEEAFGQAFKTSSLKRENVQLISKCGIQYTAEKRNNKIKHYNLSKDYVIWSAEESLKNLKIDYLDLLLLHRPSPLMQPDEIAEAVTQLKQQGKVLHFGVSNFTPFQTDLINKKVKVEVNQVQFSLTHYSPMLDGSLDHMAVNSIQPMAWSPLGSVFKEENEQTWRIKEALFPLIEKYQATADQLLLAWILRHPAGVVPVIGTTDKDRINNSVKALNIALGLEDWFSLWVASMGNKVP